MTSPAAPQVLDPALLTDIYSLQLTARNLAQGALAGMHRSLRRGTSIEFSEHKIYSPGDDIRHIDWRAYAKSDRYHIKQFEDETNVRLELLLDHSGSMGFQSGSQASKLTYARNLAAALSMLALRQGGAAGLTTNAAEITDTLPARTGSSHLVEICTRLVTLKPGGNTTLAQAITQLASSRGPRAIVVVLSDLFDATPAVIEALKHLAAGRHEANVLQILDPAEQNFPYETPSVFTSPEDSRRVFIEPRALRQAYLAEMEQFLQRTASVLAAAGLYYQLVTTDTPATQVLAAFLRRQ